MEYWRRLHTWDWRARWTLKCAALFAIVALVLYPKIWLLPTLIGRLGDMNAVLNPANPGLAELEERVRERVPPDADAQATLRIVEKVVCEAVPYAWDWDTWGVMEYIPTVSEVLEKGREDCDGRAVVAASLLRRMGYEAQLVCDLKHAWVQTPEGELMSPGEGEKTLEVTGEGTRVSLTAGALANLGRALSFGVAVFPLTRELIILTALCAVTMHPRSSPLRRVVGVWLMLLGLALLRDSGGATYAVAQRPDLLWAGLLAAVLGWVLLALRAADPRSRPAPPE